MTNRAFFSYARADGKLANWLWRQLDNYRTPKDLVGIEGKLGPVPDRLHKVFRDRDDLSAGRRLDEALQAELENSERLVVLCTPTSAKSIWVNHEVETFLRLRREDRIFPVIGAGEPDSVDPETECFPPALRGKGLLAADLREIQQPNGHVIGDGRNGGRLKLIAGMLGLELDQLARREQRRQRTLVAKLAIASIVFAGVAVAAFVQSIEAELQRRQTFDALSRVLVERAWAAIDRGEYNLASKYAIAGLDSAPAIAGEVREILARVLFDLQFSKTLIGHTHWVHTARFSPDGRQIVTASEDMTARIWQASTGQALFTLSGHTSPLTGAIFSPDNRMIVTTSSDFTAKAWSASNGREMATLEGHKAPVTSVLFDNKGVYILTLSEDYSARLWEAASGAQRFVFAGGTTAIAINPNRDVVATGTFDGFIRYWSAISGQEIARYKLHEGEVYSVAFNTKGDQVVSASRGGAAIVTEVANGRVIATISTNAAGIRSASFSPDSRLVATTSGSKAWQDSNGELRIWDAASGQPISNAVRLSRP